MKNNTIPSTFHKLLWKVGKRKIIFNGYIIKGWVVIQARVVMSGTGGGTSNDCGLASLK